MVGRKILSVILAFVLSFSTLISFPTETHALTCGFGSAIWGDTACRGYITTTGISQFTVPSDWGNASNTVEVIGGGGAGEDSDGGGGGGGAYAKKSNINLSATTSVTVQVGTGGTVSSGNGGDTFFYRYTGGATTCTALQMYLCAKGGSGSTGLGGASGGSAASSIGTTTASGGAGGSGSSTGKTGGGGGGAAGPLGDLVGNTGGNGDGTAGDSGSGGGGGGNGGGTGGTNGVDAAGGDGGDNVNGTGGGNANGEAGVDGGGGGGNLTSAGDGGNGIEYDATHGSGGGGGGGGYVVAELGNYVGGDGGLYGGGGGGGGCGLATGCDVDSPGGAGAQGIIVITYAPLVAPTVATDAADTITSSSANLNGSISDTGGDAANTCGFAWGTVATLSGGDTATTSDSTCPSGTGSFNKALGSLTASQTYYFRAYATNDIGIGYGSTIENFTTSTPSPRIIRLVGKIRFLGGVRLGGTSPVP